MRRRRAGRPRLRRHLLLRPLLLLGVVLFAADCSARHPIQLPPLPIAFANGTARAAPADPSESVVAPKSARQAEAEPPVTPDLTELQREIADYLEHQDGLYGVYVIDLATGHATGVNADQVFPAASTFKLPMAMYILNQVEQGQASLDELLTYSDLDYEEGTGILQNSIKAGDRYSVRQLVDLAITQSDNVATNMLLRRFGQESVFQYERSLGGKVTLYDADTVGTTPREMATYMWLAYGSNTIRDAHLRQFLLDLLSHTAFNDRAAAGVPGWVQVAHKIGTLPGVVNDVALVFAPRRTFIVAVYSMNVEEEQAARVIAEVTRKVYDFERMLGRGSPGVSPPSPQRGPLP